MKNADFTYVCNDILAAQPSFIGGENNDHHDLASSAV